MKHTFTFIVSYLLIFIGCDSLHNESPVATTVQYTANEDKKSSSTRGSIDDLLKESYP